jgi:hypothetical protein
VVSGAPGTGKSTIARELGAALRLPVLSLDPIKEALADVLGLGDEDWSNPAGVGSAAYIASLASDVTPLRLGGPLIEVDTGRPRPPRRWRRSGRRSAVRLSGCLPVSCTWPFTRPTRAGSGPRPCAGRWRPTPRAASFVCCHRYDARFRPHPGYGAG